MPQDKLERAIEEVVKNNNYTKEQEEQFRKFIKDLVKKYNEYSTDIESKTDRIVQDMEKDIMTNDHDIETTSSKSI